MNVHPLALECESPSLECSHQVVAEGMLVQTVSYHLNDLNLWCVGV